MDSDTYEKMVLMSTGKIPRDQAWLDKLAVEGHKKEEELARAKYEKQHPPARSHRELELEQRAFNLRMFGKSGMEKFARPLDEVDELAVPGDVPAVRLQGHSGVEPCRGPDGKLRLQNHAACPITQKLILQRGSILFSPNYNFLSGV